jgi:hypothetical protein
MKTKHNEAVKIAQGIVFCFLIMQNRDFAGTFRLTRPPARMLR